MDMKNQTVSWTHIPPVVRQILLLVSVAVVLFVLHPVSRQFTSRRLGEEDGLQATVVLLFMFFGLAIGILAMQGLSLVGDVIPYTCIVFLLGVIFSLGNNSKDGSYYHVICNFFLNIIVNVLFAAS